MYENIALVGATGAVGTIVRQLLEERDFPFQSMRFIASKRSAGSKLTFKGEEYTVVELGPDAFEGIDLIIASTPDEVAAELIPWAKAAGAVVVDESGFHRMLPEVPLVVPEVNPEAARNHQGIIASPNCSTTQMVVAMKPIHDAARIKRVIVSTYQATSGAGLAGNVDLQEGTKAEVLFIPPAITIDIDKPIAIDVNRDIGHAIAIKVTRQRLCIGISQDNAL